MTQEELLRLPKVELHCHLDGSLSQEFIEKRLGRSVKKEELSVSDDCTALQNIWKSLICHASVLKMKKVWKRPAMMY